MAAPSPPVGPSSAGNDSRRGYAGGRAGSRTGRRTIRLGGLLDDGGRVAAQTFPRLAAIILLALAPGIAALVIGYASLETAPADEIDVPRYVRTLALSVSGFFVSHAVFQPLSLAGLYFASARAFRGQAWSALEVLGTIARRAGAVVLVGALYYGGVYGLAVIGASGVAALAAGGFIAASGEVGLAVLAVLAGMATTAGSVLALGWFSLRYGLSLPVVMIEIDRPAIDSFARSAALMRGAYLSAGILLVVLIAIRFGLLIVTTSLFPAPDLRRLDVDAVFAALPSLVRIQLVQQVVGVVVDALFTFYMSACWTVLYFRLRGRADGDRGEGDRAQDAPASA